MSFPTTYANTRPPTSDPCEKCQKSQNCDSICIARARWWDARMEKIRKGDFKMLKCDPMTNADRIRAMTDEELCELLMGDPICDQKTRPDCGPCETCIMEWLRQPVEENHETQ